MLDCERIISNHQYDDQVWRTQFLWLKDEHAFLSMLSPLFYYAEIKLKKIISSTIHKNNSFNLSQNHLRCMIQQDLSHLFLPLISRICIGEMHVLSEKKRLNGKNSQEKFQHFIQLLANPVHSIELLKKYPVLKKIINNRFQQYLNFNADFYRHLSLDAKILKTDLLKGKFNEIIQMQATGDMHCDGKRVLIVSFLNQEKNKIKKILYKPRDTTAEYSYQKLLNWVNDQSLKYPLKTIVVINRRNRGWCEFVEFLSCTNTAQIKKFYTRIGYLLAILYLLIAKDMHAENIIACGEHPILVDLECIFQPTILENENQKLTSRHLVTESLLLPSRTFITDNFSGIDISGLNGGNEKQELPYTKLKFHNTGTDKMYIAREKLVSDVHKNQPKLNHKNIDISSYAQYFLAGFTECYKLICRKKHYLLGKNSPLNRFKTCKIRVLMRNTSDYSKILLESYHPELLFSQQKYLSHVNWLKKIINISPSFSKIIPSETKDIINGNIPYFSVKNNSKKIYDSQGKILPISAVQTGWNSVKKQLKNIFNEQDLLLQKSLMINSLASMNNAFIITKKSFLKIRQTNKNLKLSKKNILLSTSLKLAKRELDSLEKLKISSLDTIFWPQIKIIGENSSHPSFTDIHLYEGLSGIALSYAYASEVFNNKNYYRLASDCANFLGEITDKNPLKMLHTVGGYGGIGGQMHFFSHLYRLFGNKFYLNQVEKLCQYIPHTLTHSNLDIISGAAGCLLNLISAKDLIGEEKFFQYASLCVDFILANYTDPALFPKILTIHSSQPLVGFAHGTSGILYALAWYHEFYPTATVENWIKKALIYERACYLPEEKNWLDFRTDISTLKPSQTLNNASVHRQAVAWCHGATGIGLSRLAMPARWHDNSMQQEIKNALSTVLKRSFSGFNNLCHGNLGSIEFLMSASEKEQYLSLAQYQTIAIALLKQMRSTHAPCWHLPKSGAPGLLTGAAGIAYQLMRMAFSHEIPNILLLK